MPDSRWKLVSIRTLCGEGDGRRGKAERHQFQHFYPRPPQGGRPTIRRWTMPSGQFLSTPSARRATCAVTAFRKQLQIISIHALREEGDLRRHRLPQTAANHFYPRPPRGGRPAGVRRAVVADVISIRALREEGDRPQAQVQSKADNFYPRPPRGGRQSGRAGNNPDKRFLSTPSARRATHLTMLLSSENHISIHALREEGDKDTEGQKQQMNIFLSTPSARRATSSKKPR